MIRAVTILVATDALRTSLDLAGRGHSLGVSVNIPFRAVDDPELAAAITGLLETTGVHPSLLTLEVVPSGPGAGSDLDRTVLAGLRALGVRVSLDDFGRSSSLAAVRALPLDQVKIDSSFIHGLGGTRRTERSSARSPSSVTTWASRSSRRASRRGSPGTPQANTAATSPRVTMSAPRNRARR